MMILVVLLFAFASAEDITVQTRSSYIVGLRHDGYSVFKGIPYAQPPIGDNRLKRPKALEYGSDDGSYDMETLEAKEFKPICPQSGSLPGFHGKSEILGKQSEDCLYLNIWTPGVAVEREYPVLVWVHGGSFVTGSGSLDIHDDVIHERFIERGVILVTMNYRLGVLGFMTGQTKTDSNYGLWDIIEGLRYINDNIHAFGGDPERVTLMGVSAGAAAVSTLALSKRTEGLFNQAIVISGSVLAHFGMREFGFEDTVDYRFIYEQLTCDKDDFTGSQFSKKHQRECCKKLPERLECPREMTKLDCVMGNISAFAEPDKWHTYRDCLFNGSFVQPVIDGDIFPSDDKRQFAKDNPRMPIMLGVADFEWGTILAYGKGSPRAAMAARVRQIYPPHLRNDTLDAIEQFYLDDASRPNDPELRKRRASEAISEMEMVAPIYQEAMNYAEQGHPVYLYNFKHVPGNTVTTFGDNTKGREIQVQDAFHGLDFAYLFSKGELEYFHFKYDDVDRIVAENFTNYVTNFVKNGDPNAPNEEPSWPPFTSTNRSYVDIADPVIAHEDGFHKRGMHFFNEFLPKLLHDNGGDGGLSTHKGTDTPLSREEQETLAGYKLSWWVLWALVIITAIALLLLLCFLCYKRATRRNSIKTRTVATMTYRYT